MTRYACRDDDGRSLPNHHGSRKVLYCPECQFNYKEAGCLFAPTHTPAAFGKSTTSTRGQGARNLTGGTGGKWEPADILERIVEYHARHGEWPDNTTAFRDSPRLPHSGTVKRHFPGGIEEAVKQARELYEKENEVERWRKSKNARHVEARGE